MADADGPQTYLILPPTLSLDQFPDQLAAMLDAVPVACLRLALASTDPDEIGRAADALRAVAHARDVAIVIADHVRLAERHGLDGVHLTDGARQVRKLRSDLGGDAIIGAYCAASRHDGMTAGETGADYVAFGPIAETGLADTALAEAELFAWWTEMIELPVVAEGGLDIAQVRALADSTDFFAFGDEIWRSPDPLTALKQFVAAMA